MFVDPIPISERFVPKVGDIICCRYYELRDERESVAGDPTEDIRVVIRVVSWMSRAEREQRQMRWWERLA